MKDGKASRQATVRFSVVLPAALLAEVRELAQRTARTESAMARRLILKGLEEYRAGKWDGA